MVFFFGKIGKIQKIDNYLKINKHFKLEYFEKFNLLNSSQKTKEKLLLDCVMVFANEIQKIVLNHTRHFIQFNYDRNNRFHKRCL